MNGYINLFFIKINYGKIEINKSKRINVVFPNKFKKSPLIFITPISKGDVVAPFMEKTNIFVQNLTEKGFALVSQTRNTKMNDIAKEVHYIAIGK